MNTQKVILVVDDNRLNRAILCRILRSDGYETLEAENGAAAYEIIASGRQPVALVLLDIVMPVMDGYAFLNRMNETGAITSVPVIITTGDEDDGAEIRCLENGASDFLRKPYNAELVRHRVKSLLRLWDNAALISRLETDRLTGVLSREFFYRYAEEKMESCPEGRYSVVYTDVDDFKVINVRYGAAAGDDLLRELAGAFRTWAGEDGLCGRIGGDNFAMLLRDRPPPTQEQAGELMAGALQKLPFRGVNVKLGVCRVKDRGVPMTDLCDRAKLAVTSIKHRYGVYYAVYDDSMMARALREHQLADCMEDALAQRQFKVYLQPKHSAETGAVQGAEALARWNHPELGFIEPGDFIPLFERNGFIAKLDRYMLDEVCALLRKWEKEDSPLIPVSVNLSRLNFVSDDLPDQICRRVDASGVPRSLVHLEVTESAYTDNRRQIISIVSALREKGFLIEMDDFGSGYSSLNMLSELPIDILKMDMHFMHAESERARGGKRDILSFIISLSKWLRLPTVAEGVETQEEYDLLRSMGCDMIQGYYFAKPMPVETFEQYLRTCPVQSVVPAAKTDPPAGEKGEKPTVLVAESAEDNRKALKKLLEPYYRVETAGSGKEACAYLLKHRGEVSCLVMDLLMPEMNGFQAVELLRANDVIREIPVILTTEANGDSRLQTLHMGVNGVVAKPYDADILLHDVGDAVEEAAFWRARRDFVRESNERYEKAYRDEQTGLLNRCGLDRAMREIPSGERYAAVMLDIGGFRRAGEREDRALRTAADTLAKATRENDILARMTDDEFFVLLRGVSDPKTAEKMGGRLRGALERLELSGVVHPTCPAGVTLAVKLENSDAVFGRAEAALREAKKGSRTVRRRSDS